MTDPLFKTDIDRAWFAAVLDGEGYVGVALQSHGRKQYHKTSTMQIIITNTNLDFLNHAKKIVGGGFIYAHKPSGFGKKQIYRLVLNGNRKCRAILAELEPFLIIKRADASLAIKRTETSYQRGLVHYDPDILADIRAGIKMKEIAVKHAVGQSRISVIARANGIYRHNMKKKSASQ